MPDLDLLAEIEAGAEAIRRANPYAAPQPTEAAEQVLRAVLPDHDARVRATGWDAAVAELRAVHERTGSPAALWAADYLAAPSQRASIACQHATPPTATEEPTVVDHSPDAVDAAYLRTVGEQADLGFRVGAALAELDRIPALHQRGVSHPDECGTCNELYPCETVQIATRIRTTLTGEEHHHDR